MKTIRNVVLILLVTILVGCVIRATPLIPRIELEEEHEGHRHEGYRCHGNPHWC